MRVLTADTVARRRLLAAGLCAGMVLVPLIPLSRSGGPSRVGPVTVAAGADARTRALPERADRSSTVHLAAQQQQQDDEPTTSTTAAKPTTTTTAAKKRTTTTTAATKKTVVAAKATTATTAKPKPTTTTSTTAKPKPTTTTSTTSKPQQQQASSTGNVQEGDASYYEAASAGSCAHRTAPLGTILKVTNLANGKSTTCKVTDRGPYVSGRVVDLAKSTFSEIAPLSAGVIHVRVEW